MRYEMEGMAAIRKLVTSERAGFTHENMDTFKRMLAYLETNHGFSLIGPANDGPLSNELFKSEGSGDA